MCAFKRRRLICSRSLKQSIVTGSSSPHMTDLTYIRDSVVVVKYESERERVRASEYGSRHCGSCYGASTRSNKCPMQSQDNSNIAPSR